MHWFLIKLKKLDLGHFLFKNHSARFFPKKLFCLILILYATVTSCKNSEKNPYTDFLQNLKNLILGPIWPKNFKNGFSQKIILFSLKPLYHCRFMQKIREAPYIAFWWYLKNLALAPLQVHFCLKTSKQDFSL